MVWAMRCPCRSSAPKLSNSQLPPTGGAPDVTMTWSAPPVQETFPHHARGQDRREAGQIEWRRHFDQVEADDVEVRQAANRLFEFPERDPAGFRASGARGDRRIEDVDVDRHIDRAGGRHVSALADGVEEGDAALREEVRPEMVAVFR